MTDEMMARTSKSRAECSCQAWKVNIERINAPIVLQQIRSGMSFKFECEQFSYCPWCGKGLTGSKAHENETKPARDADHCDFPDCEQHNAHVVAQLQEALDWVLRERITLHGGAFFQRAEVNHPNPDFGWYSFPSYPDRISSVLNQARERAELKAPVALSANEAELFAKAHEAYTNEGMPAVEKAAPPQLPCIYRTGCIDTERCIRAGHCDGPGFAASSNGGEQV